MSSLAQHVPNGLSLARIALGLGFVFVPAGGRVPVVLLAALTDLLDGALSRKLQVAMGLGRLLDPLADKVFAFLVVWTLVAEGSLELWQVFLAALRDLAVLAGLAIVLIRRDWARLAHMRPTWLGKAVTAAQCLLLLSVLVFCQVLVSLLVATALLSAVAAVDYARRFVTPSRGDPHGRSKVEGHKKTH